MLRVLPGWQRQVLPGVAARWVLRGATALVLLVQQYLLLLVVLVAMLEVLLRGAMVSLVTDRQVQRAVQLASQVRRAGPLVLPAGSGAAARSACC